MGSCPTDPNAAAIAIMLAAQKQQHNLQQDTTSFIPQHQRKQTQVEPLPQQQTKPQPQLQSQQTVHHVRQNYEQGTTCDVGKSQQSQFDEKPHLLDANPTERPDYDACIAISTNASLKEMVPPGAMVIFTPLLTGIFFGVTAISGLLVGSLIASVQLAISMSNSGGAWDNAKKFIEQASPDSDLKGKGSDIHKAAVVGDTVGDPFKDTSGPALNIVMKLMAVLALAFADTFYAMNEGRGVFKTS